VYRKLPRDAPLGQGEIIADCPIVRWENTGSVQAPQWEAVETLKRVILLTQACDLHHPKTTWVVVGLVHDAQSLVDSGILKAKTIRDQLVRHQVYGWYFLPKGELLDESIVDLRHVQTIPRLLLEQLVADGKRVCALETPYREHLAQHFAATYARIGLPTPYETD
jgi:hypothetical protein